MELPAKLRQAVDHMLEGTPLSDLQKAAERLSGRYRSETRDGRLHVSDALAAKAYLAARLPATYAAIRTSLAEVAERRSGFSPNTVLDIGSGPGTALWAAAEEWTAIRDAVLVEASPAMQGAGERLSKHLGSVQISWRSINIEGSFNSIDPADLVTLCYVLDELAPLSRERLVAALWAHTKDTLVIVEPGTPAGFQRILAARAQLIDSGAYIVAPCPHSASCQIVAPDWCHFSRRVARSRLHRRIKGEVPWEDEKFIYLAASREPPASIGARVLAPPRAGSGSVKLKLCLPDGKVEQRLVTRRQGALFKEARQLRWGDATDAADE